jgi:dihydroorotate dehydrogenase
VCVPELPSPPFYDPHRTYQENYDAGPFGLFRTDPPAGAPPPAAGTYPVPPGGVAPAAFLGRPLRVPFGIPAGPVLNATFVAAAFRWGYDLVHYKTVRSRAWPAHPAPHVLRVGVTHALAPVDAPAVLPAAPFAAEASVSPDDVARLSITNSFGMPAQPPEVWQADVARAVAAAGPGQICAVSFVGSPDPDGGAAGFVRDFARTGAMVAAAGAPVIEANLSCPNIGGHGLLCQDLTQSERVCAAIKDAVPDIPLLVKLGPYTADAAGDAALAALAEALTPYVAGFSAINSVPFRVQNAAGQAALPGPGREVSGVCGVAIRDYGLHVVARLAAIRRRSGARWGIIGVGGVMTPEDFIAYRLAGADVVQGATGPMWAPDLALRIAGLVPDLVADTVAQAGATPS